MLNICIHTLFTIVNGHCRLVTRSLSSLMSRSHLEYSAPHPELERDPMVAAVWYWDLGIMEGVTIHYVGDTTHLADPLCDG